MAASSRFQTQSLMDKSLPVFRERLIACKALLEDENRALGDLIPIIELDPALSALVLSHVNKARGASTQGITTLQSAIGLLGHDSLGRLLADVPSVEDVIKKPDTLVDYERLVHRSLHAAIQARAWARAQNDRLPEEIYISALLRYIADLMLCAHAHEGYRHIQRIMLTDKLPARAAEQQILDRPLNELGIALGQRWRLPEESLASMDPVKAFNFRSTGLLLACEASRLAEQGWYTAAMKQCMELACEHLRKPAATVTPAMHQAALEAAHAFAGTYTRPAALNLLLPPDADPMPPPPTKPKAAPRIHRISKTSTATETLQCLVEALVEDLKLKRIIFGMLNKDKSILKTRFAVGFNNDPSIQELRAEVAKQVLIKQLLARPISVWLNDKNYVKLSQGLPMQALQTLQSRDFFMMSVFIADKPIGLVFADCEGRPLQEAQYKQFKSYCSLTSKVLTAQRAKAAR